MGNWQQLNTKKRARTKTVPIEQKEELQREIYEMHDRGLCSITSEIENTKTYKITWVMMKEELTEDAIRSLMNKNVSPIKLPASALKPKKPSDKPVEKRYYTEDKVMAIVNIADFHLNRFVTGEEGYGYDYDLEKASEVFKQIILEAKNRLKKNGHNIERIVLNTAGDFLNSDGPDMCTTNGTLQHDNVGYKVALKKACDLLEYAINELRQIAPVEYYYVAGNHDEQQGWSLTLYQYARFRDFKDVKVDTSANSREVIRYGNNVIILAHGDYEGNRSIDLPFTEPNAKAHISESTNIEVLTGHRHNPAVKSKNGVRWEILSSACPVSCDWTYDSGYGNDNHEATIIYYDKDYRVQQDTINTKKFLEDLKK